MKLVVNLASMGNFFHNNPFMLLVNPINHSVMPPNSKPIFALQRAFEQFTDIRIMFQTIDAADYALYNLTVDSPLETPLRVPF